MLPTRRRSKLTRSRSPSTSGLVVEYIVAIDVTRFRFPADASNLNAAGRVCNPQPRQLDRLVAEILPEPPFVVSIQNWQASWSISQLAIRVIVDMP